MGRVVDVARELRRLLSADAIVPMTTGERRRYFTLAARVRAAAVAALATILIWLLRDHSPLFLVAIGLVTYPGILVTWLTIRRRGVFAPHVWARDLTSMALFSVMAPPYVVPALMSSLMILAFCCYTLERRSTWLLSVLSVVSIGVAGIFMRGELSYLSYGFFVLSVIGIVVPTTLVASSLHRSRATTDRIADALGLCLWENDDLPIRPTSEYYVYGNTERLLGLPNNVVLTNDAWNELLHPDDAAANEHIDELIARGSDYRVRYRQRGANGIFRWIEEVGHVEVNADGEPVRVSGLTHDIDSIIETDEQLKRLDNIVDALPIAVAIVHLVDLDDPTSLILVYENRASAAINLTCARLGTRMIDIDDRLFDVAHHRGLGYKMAEVAAGGAPFSVPDAHMRLLGETRLHSMRMSPLPHNRAAIILEDVHELATARLEMERLAFVDPLTDLPSRTRLRQALASAPVGSALAVIDLDRFTDLNDAFGHACGDEMLIEVARVLADAPDGVLVGRLGSDEFGVIAPPGTTTHADLGRRIEAALRRPFTLPNGLTLQSSASIGITTKSKVDTPPDELLRQADVAVNRAKRLRSGLETYAPGTDTSAPHRMMLMGEIRRAIQSRELELHYQPIVSCDTGRIVRFEALLRWRHPSLGLLQTGDLVDMMELSNLNNDLVRHCLDLAIEQCLAWNATGHVVPISINVGGGTIHDAELVTAIVKQVTAAALPPFTIGIELTERQLMLGAGISGESTRRLADAGVWIAIDHFGTGASPLSALPHIAVHALKIDHAFVDDLRSGNVAMVLAILTMAHNLGLVLAVTGVDDAATLSWLVAHGVDRMQGAAVGEPVPAAEVARLLEREFSAGAAS